MTKVEKINLAKLEQYEKYEWFVEVTQLQEGQSFGELALLNDAPRAATIFCLSNCYFATLDKSEYLRVLRRIDKK